jgi:MYXO-CTERM domain-containing protein
MRNNTMTKCAVGAMLFGGTLGMSQAASADLVFNSTGPSAPGVSTKNLAFTDLGNYVYDEQSNSSFAATTFTLSSGLSASWSATSNTSGFVTTVLASAITTGGQSFVETNRSFTVTGTQEITLSWSGSYNLLLGKSTGSGWSPAIAASGWSTASFGGSSNASSSGTLTTTLGAGTYWLANDLSNVAGASFSFTVPAIPAPGAAALIGLAGLVAGRRRRN